MTPEHHAAKWAVDMLEKLFVITGITLTAESRAKFETLRAMGKAK